MKRRKPPPPPAATGPHLDVRLAGAVANGPVMVRYERGDK